MKRIYLAFFFTLCAFISAQAQVPQLINYQAVARDNSGAPIPNQSLGLRLSILDGSPSGTVLYQETQTSPTNQFGLFTLQIGSGTVVSGTFAGINWGTNIKYIKVEMDPAGGTNYTVIGASQLMSVPYALYAQTTANPGWNLTGNAGTTSGTDFIGTTDNQPLVFKVNGVLSGSINYNNTSYGYQALNAITTGSDDNTAIGYQSLFANTSGYENVANGSGALYANTTGAGNVANGYNALNANTTGYSNVANGDAALNVNTTGVENVANGNAALYDNTIGSYNTANGQRALFANVSGTNNTADGSAALSTNTTGNYNTALGNTADVSTGALSNATAIGNGASVNASNKVAIGNTSISSIQGQVAFTTFSDARVKNNVQPNVPGLAFITALRPVTYHYDVKKENELLGVKNDTANWTGKYDIEKMTFSGFIAQEVDATAQQIGYDFSGVDKSGALFGIRYSDFIPSLVKAIQEQQQVIKIQQQTITSLQERIQAITQAQTETNTRLNKLEASITK